MTLTAFPEPKDLEVDFVQRIGDSKPKSFQMYDVSNPHPGFGKDPNILNEYGHSVYPKMVYPKGPGGAGVPVQNAQEEAEVMGAQEQQEAKTSEQPQQKAW